MYIFINTYFLNGQLQSGQGIWSRVKGSSKAGREKKSFTSIFACFVTSTARVGFLEWGLGVGLCLYPNL